MKCPVCPQSALVMSDRQGIEIDYCPTCRGVWLDRGELDKIIERSATAPAMAQPAAPQAAPHYPPQHSGYPGKSKDYYKPQKSWLHELFD